MAKYARSRRDALQQFPWSCSQSVSQPVADRRVVTILAWERVGPELGSWGCACNHLGLWCLPKDNLA